MKDARAFTRAMWEDENTYNKPARMDIYDAASNLSEYIAEGVEVPDILTPALYAILWNRLCRTHGLYC